MPRVSVIIPTYNRYDFLIKAVASVKSQSFNDFELIIVDDGSIDKTCRLQSTNFVDCPCQIIRQKNKGPAAARNTGAKIASGDWLAFLDSDDTWHKDKLQEQISHAKQNPDYNIFYSDEIWIRKGVRVNKKNIHKKFSGWIYPHLTKICFVGTSSLLIKKSLYEKSGGMNEKFPVAEDHEFYLRLAANNKFFLIDKPLVTRTGGRADQLSFSFKGIDKYRILALKNMMDFPNLKPEWKKITCDEMLKKCKIYLAGCKNNKNVEGIKFCEEIFNSYE